MFDPVIGIGPVGGSPEIRFQERQSVVLLQRLEPDSPDESAR